MAANGVVVMINLLLLCVLAQLAPSLGQLKMGFYDQTCPQAEKIVLDYVRKHIPNVPSLAAALLRMHFHDCFVRGCDASVLLTSTRDNSAEKDAPPNRTLRGFDFIDRIKRLLEEVCPGVVSCADILSLAARDAVVVTGGPSWKVPTGRRDGVVSNSTEPLSELPAPKFNFTALRTKFASKGLDVKDLVLLSAKPMNQRFKILCFSYKSKACMGFGSNNVLIAGAHTIGIAHCSSFSIRLYNFTGRGDQDPSLDSEYAANLRQRKCRTPTDKTTIVEMDPGSFRTFDLSYYSLLLKRRGLFHSDSTLTTNSASLTIINRLLNGPLSQFFEEFALSMEKMGRIEVKTGTAGEIRKHCAVVNN